MYLQYKIKIIGFFNIADNNKCSRVWNAEKAVIKFFNYKQFLKSISLIIKKDR